MDRFAGRDVREKRVAQSGEGHDKIAEVQHWSLKRTVGDETDRFMKSRSSAVIGIVLLTLGLGYGACGGSPTGPTLSQPPTSTAITPAPVNSIAIVPAENALKVGETRQFSFSVELGPGVPTSGPLPVWSSTNPSVVAIDGSGAARGVAVGEAVIQVLFRGKTATRQIGVVP